MSPAQARSRPLRLAVIAPRFASTIVGGSERFLHRLLTGLAARDVEIEILTTRSERVLFDGTDSIRWDERITSEREVAPFRVARFAPAESLPRRRRRWQRDVRREWDRATERLPAPVAWAHLAAGFHAVETTSSGRPIRWTGSRATIALGRDPIESVELDLHATHEVCVRVSQGQRGIVRVPIRPAQWQTIASPLEPGGAPQLHLDVAPARRYATDERLLGVAVGGVRLVSGRGRSELSLGCDDAAALASVDESETAKLLDARCREMSMRTSWAEAHLKGPWSAALLRMALAAARRCDVVVATNAPYATLPLGRLVARLARRPFAVIPFLHLRDPQHHRPHLRWALAGADLVLCLGEAEEGFVGSALGGEPCRIGGGVDEAEFRDAAAAGERFRERFGLGGERVVVQVGRKSPEKGYRMSVEAVERLREGGLPVRLVLVGPDEDGAAIRGDGVLVLGCVERDLVIAALAASDVFVLPSTLESFGLAYLEAWMVAKPVVGHTRCAAAANLIRPGVDGELVATTEELADSLRRLLTDEAYRARLGQEGQKRALAQPWDAVVGRTETALARLVEARPTLPGV